MKYTYDIKNYVNVNNEKKENIEENFILDIKEEIKNKNEKKYTINLENLNNDDVYERLEDRIYAEIKKEFTPLEIEYKDKDFVVINKENILKKLEKKTFDYFKKFRFKGEIVNTILFNTKKSLEYEDLEREIEENSIYPYLFKKDDIRKFDKSTIIKTQTPEMISGWFIPSVISYELEIIDTSRRKITFVEKLDEDILDMDKIEKEYRELLKLSSNEKFNFEFYINGHYIYNSDIDVIEEIMVIKNMVFHNLETRSERKLGLIALDIEIKEKINENEKLKKEIFYELEKLSKKLEINRKEVEKKLKKISEIEVNLKEFYTEIENYINDKQINEIKFDTGAVWTTRQDVLDFFLDNLTIVIN